MLLVSHDSGTTWATRTETAETRKCPDCKDTLPATSEYFDPGYGRSAKYLSRRCRPCESKRLWRDPEWFWLRQQERDLAHADGDEKAWGGHETRFGNILDAWPEYGEPDHDDGDGDVVEDDYSEDSRP